MDETAYFWELITKAAKIMDDMDDTYLTMSEPDIAAAQVYATLALAIATNGK